MSKISSCRRIEDKHDVYRGKYGMKKFCKFLREHAMKIINSKKKKMKLLTKEQQKSYENSKICYVCQETFENKYLKDKKFRKVRDHCHYTGQNTGAAHSIRNFKKNVHKNIPTVFHNGSNYDYQFITKELAQECKKKQFTWLGENTEKYIIFTALIEKKLQELIKMEKKLQEAYHTY